MSGLVGSPLFLATSAAEGGYQISRSLRFNSSDSAFLSRTPASAGNRKTWTWAGWVKRSGLGRVQNIFRVVGALTDTTVFQIRFMSNDAIGVVNYSYFPLISTPVYRDASAWYHLVVALDTTQATAANRLRFYINGTEITTWATDNRASLTQNSDQGVNQASVAHEIGGQGTNEYLSGYLADIHFIDGQALTPSSFTEVSATTGQLIPKAYTGSYGTNGFHLDFSDNSTAAALGTDTSGNGNDWTVNNLSVIQGTGDYSGTLAISLGSIVNYTLSFDGDLTTAAQGNTSLPSAGSTGTITFTPTTAIPATSLRVYGDFGNTGFVKQEISVNGGSYQLGGGAWAGGWYDLSASITGGVISSLTTRTTRVSSAVFPPFFVRAIEVDGVILVDNRLRANNDSLVDTPVSSGTDAGNGGEVRGNYATWSPLDTANSEAGLSNGNLDINWSATNGHARKSTIAMRSGKWYCEITRGSSSIAVGLVLSSISALSNWPGSTTYGASGSYSYNSTNGNKRTNGSLDAYGNTFAAGDVIGIAFDADNGKLWFSKNGTWQASGDPAAGTNAAFTGIAGEYCFCVGYYDAPTGGTNLSANFGQRPFAYPAPSGFKALCTTNLPAPVVAKPNTVMDVALWTGNGSARSITGLGFSPDFVWIKGRSGATDHALYDAVRGATIDLVSNSNAAETTQTQGLTAFNSDGFSLGTLAKVNTNTATYAGWCWDAGSSTVTNTQGSITSSVRANASAGFSIVTFTKTANTNETIGHGLNVAPSLVIVKTRQSSGYTGWAVYHISTGSNGYLELNTTSAFNTLSTTWNNTAPTSSVFSMGTGWTATQNMVAYCFAPVDGYSAMGSYQGNGSLDGVFVHTGHRVRWLIIKRTDGADTWQITDAVRSNYNPAQDVLYADTNQAEVSSSVRRIDFLSNGFKIRANNPGINAAGGTYVYVSFAEHPFQYARAR